MQQEKKNFSIGSSFTFLLLLSFLLFSLMLAGIGSAIYRRGAESLNENYTTRTALSYISEKVRQYDSAGMISLTSIGENPALCLREQRKNDSFLTYIYFYDGALRELFTRESTEVTPDMGSPIAELSACSFLLGDPVPGETGMLLTVHAADSSGHIQSLLIHTSSCTEVF